MASNCIGFVFLFEMLVTNPVGRVRASWERKDEAMTLGERPGVSISEEHG